MEMCHVLTYPSPVLQDVTIVGNWGKDKKESLLFLIIHVNLKWPQKVELKQTIVIFHQKKIIVM